MIETYLAKIVSRRSTIGYLPSYVLYVDFIMQKGIVDIPWARQVDLDHLQQIFVLLNLNNNHWALGILNKETNTFEIYDSINQGKTYKEMPEKETLVNNVIRYFAALYDLRGKSFQIPLIIENVDIPQQKNGYDCGVFVLMYAHYYVENGGVAQFDAKDFRQHAVDNFRQKIVAEIYKDQQWEIKN